MPDERQIDLHFPKLGLELAGPRNRWPRVQFGDDFLYHAHDGVNVRSYAGSDGRFRGGSRPGTSKLLADRVAGEHWVVQELATVVTTDRGLSMGLVAYYKLESDLKDSTARNNHLAAEPTPVPAYAAAALGSGLSAGGGYRKPLAGLVKSALSISAWFTASGGVGAGGGTGFGRGAESGDGLRLAYRSNGVAGKIVLRNRTGTDLLDSGFVYTLGSQIHAVATYNGSKVRLTVNNVSVGVLPYTISNNWHALTFGIDTAGADFTSGLDEVGVWSRALSADEVGQLFNAGAGRRPFKEPAGGKMQVSQSGRVVTVVAVSKGTVYAANPGDTAWTEPANNTGEIPALNLSGVLASAAVNQKLYLMDGINYVYYDPSTASVELLAASAGTLPADSDNNVGRIAATWRGRLLVSGIFGDPHNIFASAQSDPTDFDYSPAEPSATQAWALNTGELGLIGDVVTGLCPWTDDVLIVFCDHSVFKLTGDPAAGGDKDLVTDKVGCAFGTAWCKAPDGTVYWVSNRNGIWSMAPGGAPQKVSTKIDSLLADLDMGRNIFTMAYDDRREEIRVFVTWVDNPQETTHFTIELRSQSWFKDVFANTDHNPLCVCEFDGNQPGDRKILLGGWDGYVRFVDHDADTDDGEPIESEVLIGPLLTSNTDEVQLTTLQAVMGAGSDPVAYDVLLGRTAEEALEAEGVAGGVFSESRGYNQVVKRSAHAIYLRLKSTGRWAMESIRAGLSSVLSKVRRRRRD